jgi:HD-GYP domain-containing protein (c-di-GMP phosphodiesterase class II)
MQLSGRLRLRLRVIIILGALAIVAGLSLSLAVSGYRSAREALLSASLDDAARHGRAIEGEVRRLIDPAETVLRLLAHDPLLQAGAPPPIERLPVLAEAFEADPLIDAAYVGYPDGGFALFRPLHSDAARHALAAPEGAALLIQLIAIDPAGGKSGQWRYYDAEQRLIATESLADTIFDPRQRSWYRAASAEDGIVLTDPYIFFTTQVIGLTMAQRTAGGRAVIGLDVRLDALDTALDHLRGTPGTMVALVAGNGAVLAGPPPDRLVMPEGNGVRLVRIDELGGPGFDPGFQQIFAAAHMEGNTAGITQTIDAAGRTYQTSAVPVAGIGPQAVWLMIAIPIDELLTSARGALSRLGLVVIAVVALALAAGWLIAHVIASPMQALSREVADLANFNFDRGVTIRSRVVEVDDLAQAAQRTTATIRGFLGITRALNEETDLDRMLVQVLDQLVEATQSSAGAVYLLQAESSMLERAAFAGRGDPARFELSLPLQRDERPVSAAASALAAALADAAAETGRGAVSAEGLVAVALRTRDGELVGVLALEEPAGDRTERRSVLRFVQALAGTAAVAIETRQLIGEQKAMMDGLIKLIAGAVDAKSPYTGGHCQRVPVIAQMLAEAAHDATSGPYAGFRMSEEDRQTLHVAAWLHDCGKVTTPEHVVDKATKLETIHNRIHEIRTRFEVLKRDAEIKALRAVAAGADRDRTERELAQEWAALDADFAFVAECNLGSEAMDPTRIVRLKTIGTRTWQRSLDDRLGLSRAELESRGAAGPAVLPTPETLLADRKEHIVTRKDTALFAFDNPWGFRMEVPRDRMNFGELYNLSITRGTLTPEERHIINDHIVQTIVILSKLPLPRHLRRAPEIAGGHHERMDGKGYPRRLRGGDMSDLARMMAIADVFEALTAADRPYKPAKTLSQSLAIMAAMAAEGHLDPELYELFLVSGVYHRYAEAYLDPAQLDTVDIGHYLARAAAE